MNKYKVIKIDGDHLESLLNFLDREEETYDLVGIYPEHVYDITLF